MARANLAVDDDIKEQFVVAVDARFIRLALDLDAERISLAGTSTASSDAAADVAAYAKSLTDDVDTSLLCLNPGEDGAKKWLLVSYVPDEAPPKARMVAAASRQDIRSVLGYGAFEGEFHASSASEITLVDIERSMKHDTTESMSELEKEKKREHLESSMARGLKTATMGVVPFAASADLTTALDEFASSSAGYVEARVELDGETLELVSSAPEASVSSLGSRLPADQPRFVLMRTPDSDDNLFILWCPDEAPPRAKMVASTAKATLTDLTDARGLKFNSIQARSDADLVAELTPAAKAPVTTTLAEGGGFARPSRPGRGRRTLIRKK